MILAQILTRAQNRVNIVIKKLLEKGDRHDES
jgi:hypothetical protein